MPDTTLPSAAPPRARAARRPRGGALSWIALGVAVLVMVPLLAVLWTALAGLSGGGGSAGGFAGGFAGDLAGAERNSTWAHLAATVLPEYVRTTVWLALGTGLLATAIGTGAAWLVTHHDFPLRRALEWALVLPLAFPAYVLAYTYADWLQFAGPVQTALRAAFGWSRGDYGFPDVRSTGGAIAMLGAVLYPYVYLLARIAFLERGHALVEAGRSLGLGPAATFFRISLPMARPAIAAGAALVLMETLADYGTVAYFGVQTFTTGVYRAWFSLGDRTAAAQLALCLVTFVLLLLAIERLARGHRRYAVGRDRPQPPPPVRLHGVRAGLALVACALPVVAGFALPAVLLLRMSLADGDAQFGPRFLDLARNSLIVAGCTAAVALVVALLLSYARRLQPGPLVRSAHALAGLGYAFPGAVIAVGTLVPLARLDNLLAGWLTPWLGRSPGLLLTGSITALVYACVVRFLATALQTTDAALVRITPSMDDAARSLGHGPWATLGRVHAPLLRRGMLTAALLVFVDTLKELPATLVLRPFDFDTLATQVWRLASDERLAEASTASLAIVVAGLLPLVVLSREITRGRGGTGGVARADGDASAQRQPARS